MTGRPPDPELLAQQLNERVIRHLSMAGFALSGLAGSVEDPRRSHGLLGCVADIDATISRIRGIVWARGDGPHRDELQHPDDRS